MGRCVFSFQISVIPELHTQNNRPVLTYYASKDQIKLILHVISELPWRARKQGFCAHFVRYAFFFKMDNYSQLLSSSFPLLGEDCSLTFLRAWESDVSADTHKHFTEISDTLVAESTDSTLVETMFTWEAEYLRCLRGRALAHEADKTHRNYNKHWAARQANLNTIGYKKHPRGLPNADWG